MEIIMANKKKEKEKDSDGLNVTKSTTMMNKTGPSYHIGPVQLGVDSPFTIINEEDYDLKNGQLHIVDSTKYNHQKKQKFKKSSFKKLAKASTSGMSQHLNGDN